MGDKSLGTGTAIATFADRSGPRSRADHAASHRASLNGRYIIDQWNCSDKEAISSRFIYRLGKNKDELCASQR